MEQLARYKVLYSFRREEEGEVDVDEGEIVVVSSGEDGVFGTEDDTRDGWMMVEKENGAIGYVPVDYLEEYAAAPAPSIPQAPSPRSYTPTSYSADANPLASTFSNINTDLSATKRMVFKTSTTAPTAPSLSAAAAGENYERMQEQNNAYFQKICVQRDDLFKEVESGAKELNQRLNSNNRANDVLGEKIKQLQEQIDKEARKAKRARDEDAHQLAVSGN
jgi:hypothetical protein